MNRWTTGLRIITSLHIYCPSCSRTLYIMCMVHRSLVVLNYSIESKIQGQKLHNSFVCTPCFKAMGFKCSFGGQSSGSYGCACHPWHDRQHQRHQPAPDRAICSRPSAHSRCGQAHALLPALLEPATDIMNTSCDVFCTPSNYMDSPSDIKFYNKGLRCKVLSLVGPNSLTLHPKLQ